MARPKSAEEARKLVGKRTPLPGGPRQEGPNFKAKSEPPSSPSTKQVDFLNPRAVLAKREKEAGLRDYKRGGKVKK